MTKNKENIFLAVLLMVTVSVLIAMAIIKKNSDLLISTGFGVMIVGLILAIKDRRIK